MIRSLSKWSMKSIIKKYGMLLVTLLLLTVETSAQNINIPNKTGPMGLQVNTLTGNLYFTRNDLYIPARGFALNITFHYNSFNFEQNDGYGNGWSFNYNIKYRNDTAGAKIIVWSDGREDIYSSAGGGSFLTPRGFFNTLTEYQSGKYRITETDGTKFFFDNSTHKRVTRMEEPNGNFINFSYTDTLLTSLVNGAGQSITLAYTNGKLTTITDAISIPVRIYTYSYDGAGNLIQAKDPLNNTYKYSYLVNGPMKAITDKNNNKVDIIYFNNFTISELIGCNKRISFSYDTATLTTLVTDYLEPGNNQVTKYEFKKQEDKRWLSGISGNCCGFNMKFEFDAAGNKIKETDAKGNVTTFTYDSRGNMLTMTDAMNHTVTYTYTTDYNKVASFTDERGFTTTMAYDIKGNLTQLVEPGNLVYTATYAANGDIISSTDPKGNIFSYNYDTYGNPTNVIGPNGYTAALGFDARSNLLSFTDARGNTSNLEYDILDRLKKTIDPINNNALVNYDNAGNPVSYINENNETSLAAYDASNRPVEITNIKGGKAFITYDAMDNIKSITNVLGNITKFDYDNRNRLKKVTDHEGNTTTAEYDDNGNITAINIPNGQRMNFTYDALDRISSVTDNTGNILNFTYDIHSNISSYTNGSGATHTMEYDSLNRIKKITDPLNNTYQLTYDKNSNIISIKDRNGFTSNFTYDSLDRVKTATGNNGNTVTSTYDAVGNVVSLKDQNNNITNYTYDSLNRVKRTTYPDGRFIEYTYDNKWNMIAKRLTDGTIINFAYDSLNRVVSKTLPGGHIFNYTYDALGRLLTAANSNGTVTLAYDALNRITSETYGGRTVNYSYNVSGRTKTTVYPDSTVITKSYDSRNRLLSISRNNVVLVSYQYNNLDQVISKNFANGITTSYQYDFANRLSNISTASGSIQNSSFTYNNEQQKTSINRQNEPTRSEQFTYDNESRLINYKRGFIGGFPVVENTYNYDALGNRTAANLNGAITTYTSNNLNQLINSNNGTQNINFSYDNNGNLTYDGQFHKQYDAEGRLIKDSSSPVNVITYQYDALNRRISKNINGNILNYTFSGIAQIEERDNTSGTVLNKTIFSGFLTPVVNEKNNNQFFYHQNELNSVEAITTQQGRLLEKYDYDIYGKMSIYDSLNNPLPGSLAGNRFGFTGQVYDSATGSYKFFFREYNPSTGLFNERDLIGYADGMGLYQYIHNNPANGIDPLGLLATKDPCAHDPNKVRFISNEMIQEELEAMRKHARTQAIEYESVKWFNFPATLTINLFIYGKSNYEAGLNADSRFYETLGSETHGSHKYYFDSQVQNSWVVNYYFTAHSLAAMGTSQNFGSGQAWGWDVGKGLLGAEGAYLKNYGPFNPIKSNMEAYKALEGRLHENPAKMKNVENGFKDYEAYKSGKQVGRNPNIPKEYQYRRERFGDWWPVINPKTGELGYEFFPKLDMTKQELKEFEEWYKKNCPQNNAGGTQKPPGALEVALSITEAIASWDPNEIIGPDGVPDKSWVSINDRLPYTVTFENDISASAPAKYVKVVVPVHEKMDAATFQLGSFGFNSLTFTVPPAAASHYQRLDCRDSLGLYVDVIAGYDVVNNYAFWEFQSIDPVTFLPPADPLKGFLLLQDSTNQTYGHGFVNFSIKPVTTAQTLDSILARADIVFDANDTIPTNIEKNTIDALPPTSQLNNLPSNSNNPVTLNWSGADDTNGCGLHYYTLYISNDGTNFSVLKSGITRTDTTLTLTPNIRYYFFVLATDSVGNTEVLRPGEIKNTFIGATLPVNWLYFRGNNRNKDNLLEWATSSEQNSKEFKVERSLDAINFSAIVTVPAAGNSSSISTYDYTDRNIDQLNSSVMYYRLRQVDLDNNYSYSAVVRLTYKETATINSIVYPNPASRTLTITVGDKSLVGTMASVYDMNGRLIESIKISAQSQTVDISRYTNGIYLIRLDNKETLKVIKQ